MTPSEELTAAAKTLRDPACGLRKELADRIADWLAHCAHEVAATKRTLDHVGRRPGYSDLEEVDEPDSVRHALNVARSINNPTGDPS